jgi:hypothetical protein
MGFASMLMALEVKHRVGQSSDHFLLCWDKMVDGAGIAGSPRRFIRSTDEQG